MSISAEELHRSHNVANLVHAVAASDHIVMAACHINKIITQAGTEGIDLSDLTNNFKEELKTLNEFVSLPWDIQQKIMSRKLNLHWDSKERGQNRPDAKKLLGSEADEKWLK